MTGMVEVFIKDLITNANDLLNYINDVAIKAYIFFAELGDKYKNDAMTVTTESSIGVQQIII